METTQQLKFKTISGITEVTANNSWGGTMQVPVVRSYEVRLNGTLAGTVHKTPGGLFTTQYTDGTPGYTAYSRKDAAWVLINS